MALRRTLRALGLAAALALPLGMLSPAGAIHIFPVTPAFDPLGHDCAKALSADPGTSAGTVAVAGFSFVDLDSNSSVTTIAAGQSVTWSWLFDHCHSVTFVSGAGTYGATGYQPAQPQLVRVNGSNAAFTMQFQQAGTYAYSCVHHASVGMVGQVVVTP